MAGLDKILQEIEAGAAAEAARQIEEAKAKAGEILAQAQTESDAACAQIGQEAAKAVAEEERSRASALALQRRKETLQAKQQLLAETLDKARGALYVLPEKEYFDLLARLAAKNAAPGEGVMLLNEKDLARLPGGFEKQVQAALPPGSSIALSKETRPLDGGFVLQYGDIEVNCSFSAIFDAGQDEMADRIRDILFA